MKKTFLSVTAVCLLLAVVLSGCGQSDKLYAYDLSKYVTLDSYAVEVDTTSATYQNYYSNKLDSGLSYQKTEGTVANGDTANIDFVGYLNGEAFSGGTGSDYDLTIGSGQFIPGFEEALIGAVIGETTDINVTFPEDYGVEDLNGQPVVFSVTINYVQSTYELNDENVRKLGYESLAAYEKEAKDYAVLGCAWNEIYGKAEIKDTPKKESDIMFNAHLNYYKTLCEQNDATLDDLAAANNMTMDEMNTYIKDNDVANSIERDLISYSILAAEKRTVTKEDISRANAEFEKQYGQTAKELGYDEVLVETYAAYLVAGDILLENAIVK